MSTSTSIYSNPFGVEPVSKCNNLVHYVYCCDSIYPLFRLNIFRIKHSGMITFIHNRNSYLNGVRAFIGTIHSDKVVKIFSICIKAIQNIWRGFKEV